MRLERFQSFGISLLLSGRGWNRPASERINAPGTNVVGVGFGWIRLFQRFGVGHITITDGNKSRGPFVLVGGVDFFKSFAHVSRIKPDQRVHAVLGAMDSFSLDFVESALAALLRRDGSNRCEGKKDDKR